MKRAERHLPATSAPIPGAGGHQTVPTGVGSRTTQKEAGCGSPHARDVVNGEICGEIHWGLLHVRNPSSLQVHGLEMLLEEENYPIHSPDHKFSKDLLFSTSSWEPRCCMGPCFDLGPSCVLVRPSDIRSP